MNNAGCQAAEKGEDGMRADDLLCSRNARPQKALVERAQWKINPPIPEEGTNKLGRIIYFALNNLRL